MSAEIVQFVPRPRASRPSERLRMRIIRDARARYQAKFPDEPSEDTAPCECNPSPENLA